MANPITKAFKYLAALFNNKIDENADPKIQIEQAIAEATKRHKALSDQAASVIGNVRQLEMQLGRKDAEVKRLEDGIRKGLEQQMDAEAKGDTATAQNLERALQSMAVQLTSAKGEVESLKQLYTAAAQQAEQAKAAVETNSQRLRQQVTERTKLLSQLEQAKMQERVAQNIQSMNSVMDESVPSLDAVRDKIEARYAKALGASDLAQNDVNYQIDKITMDASAIEANDTLAAMRQEIAQKRQGEIEK
ncbi:MAG: PspA/IM30 family protein [Corynebacterium sp.]|nr:PspA/IM30 family protein [Corynebacterium sp.]